MCMYYCIMYVLCMYYVVLCTIYYVLCTMYYVLCIVYGVLCIVYCVLRIVYMYVQTYTYVFFLADCKWERVSLRQLAQVNSDLCPPSSPLDIVSAETFSKFCTMELLARLYEWCRSGLKVLAQMGREMLVKRFC